MKSKTLIVILFMLLFALPAQAQRYYNNEYNKFYILVGGGLKTNSACFRVGLMQEKLGGELYLKKDLNLNKKDFMEMDGKAYHFSLMGGVTYAPAKIVMLTLNAGYGSTGTYRVDATETNYGVEGLRSGLELGLCVTIAFPGGFSVFGGYSLIPASTFKNSPGKEVAFGMGFTF